MAPCRCEKSEERAVFAEDLADFLKHQVRLADVRTVMMTPEPGFESLPKTTPPDCRPERFFIGDRICCDEAPESSGLCIQGRTRASSASSAGSFYIGDFKKAKPKEHQAETFYMGDDDVKPARRRCSKHGLAPDSSRRPNNQGMLPDEDARQCAENIAPLDAACNMDMESLFEEELVPRKSRTDVDALTPEVGQAVFTRKMLEPRNGPRRLRGTWGTWVCSLGCTARDREDA